MKHLLVVLSAVFLASCTHFINQHRMKAAERKMLDTRRLQQAGQWDEAFAMALRMQSSVSKAVTSAPKQKYVAETKAVPWMVDLIPLLAAWENGPLTELKSALQKKDAGRSTAAFTELRLQCVNCHSVTGRSELKMPVSEIP